MMSGSDCVLLQADACGHKIFYCSATAAGATTRGDMAIDVSLSCPESSLRPSILFASGPGLDFTNNPPCIVRAVEDLILLRVLVGRSICDDVYDYFIYRPGGKNGPSLKRLPHTSTVLADEDIGLLRHGEEDYTVAALLATSNADVYDLHRFDSLTESWSMDRVSLVEPQVSFPYKKIPRKSQRILYHLTSTVIPIGGEGGTMGWVDLWRGILLCDVLSAEPKLRGVPLPLPLDHLSCNNGRGTHLGCPKSLRGITFIDKLGMEPCLKFVHLGVTAVPIHADDSDLDQLVNWEMQDWTITTWSNNKMTSSWEDWHVECEVEASRTTISSELNSKMLKSGLLSPPGGAEPERAFHNLLVSSPAIGIDGVVYLQARVKFFDTKVFALALDTRDNKLQGAIEFATAEDGGAAVVYFPSNIGKYINPENKRDMPTPEGDSKQEGSSLHKGTKSQKVPRVKFRIFRRIYGHGLGQGSLNDATIGT